MAGTPEPFPSAQTCLGRQLPANMARKQALAFTDLILDLIGDPTGSITEIEVRCDCLLVSHRPPVLPRYITTSSCVLAARGSRGVELRRRIYSWCDTYRIILYFACPFWERAEDFAVRLRQHYPREGPEE